LVLSIAKGIVDAHGVTIWAECHYGRGSPFLLTLPLADSDAKQTESVATHLH